MKRASHRDRRRGSRESPAEVDRGARTDRPKGILGERCDLAVGDDLPVELAVAADDSQFDRRPADSPGVEPAALPRVQRPDQLDRQLGIRRESGGRWMTRETASAVPACS